MMFPRKNGIEDDPTGVPIPNPQPSGFTSIYISLPVPHSTRTTFTGTETQFSRYLSTNSFPTGQSAATTNPAAVIGVSNPNNQNDDGGNSPLSQGMKAGVAMLALVAIAAIVLASVWFCCGCCGVKAKWARRKAAQRRQEAAALPLHTISSHPHDQSRELSQPGGLPVRDLHATDLPPPSYEEVVPPQHQRLAGGLPNTNDDEDGMVVDGKTPLSEIPFEDVVLDHSPTGSSSSASSANQAFSTRHHNQYGDTSGHTNS